MEHLLTIFSIPKPFTGHIDVIQKNAIKSWTKLSGCSVLLFGDEEGLSEVAAELGVQHEPQIDCNDHGTPMVSDAFDRARNLADTPMLAYVNSDIILTSSFVSAATIFVTSTFNTWLMVGRRYDVDITELINFDDQWESSLRNNILPRAVLHGRSGMDYFLFPKNFPLSLPPMAVGRPGWDSSFIYQTRAAGIPLVDATSAVLILHQNHPAAYTHNGPEAQQNLHIAGGTYRLGTLRDADWILQDKRAKGLSIRRRILGTIMFLPPIRLVFAMKRFIQLIR